MEWSEPVLATLEQSELDFRLSDYIRFQNAAAPHLFAYQSPSFWKGERQL